MAIKLINKLSHETTQHLFSSMLNQLKTQARNQEDLERELYSANKQLEFANKKLVNHQCVIRGLEEDLVHAIEQLNHLRQRREGADETSDMAADPNKWINRPVPGLGVIQSF